MSDLLQFKVAQIEQVIEKKLCLLIGEVLAIILQCLEPRRQQNTFGVTVKDSLNSIKCFNKSLRFNLIELVHFRKEICYTLILDCLSDCIRFLVCYLLKETEKQCFLTASKLFLIDIFVNNPLNHMSLLELFIILRLRDSSVRSFDCSEYLLIFFRLLLLLLLRWLSYWLE